MNGYDWAMEAACSTDGAKASFSGPRLLVRQEIDHWLGEHDGHEMRLEQKILRPAEEAEATPATELPEFMRTVQVSEEMEIRSGIGGHEVAVGYGTRR